MSARPRGRYEFIEQLEDTFFEGRKLVAHVDGSYDVADADDTVAAVMYAFGGGKLGIEDLIRQKAKTFNFGDHHLYRHLKPHSPAAQFEGPLRMAVERLNRTNIRPYAWAPFVPLQVTHL